MYFQRYFSVIIFLLIGGKSFLRGNDAYSSWGRFLEGKICVQFWILNIFLRGDFEFSFYLVKGRFS